MHLASAALPTSRAIVATVVVPFGCGYYLSYLFRSVNAVLAPVLIGELGLTPAELGLLTSAFFFAFAAFQLPLGVLLDRYGPRLVQSALLLVAAAGAALFCVGNGFTVLFIARALIGLGVAGCLMSSFKANAMWWPKERIPLANTVVTVFGSVGALSATLPVQALVGLVGWRGVFAVLAAVTVGVAALIYFGVPERAGGTDRMSSIRAQIAALPGIFVDPFFWRIGFLCLTTQGIYLSYQTLWAGPWLRDVAGKSPDEAAALLLLMQSGMLVGVLTFGVVADRLRKLRGGTVAIFGIGMAAFIVVQAALAFELTQVTGLLWFLFTLTGAASFLAFAIFAQHFSPAMVGRVNTAGNLLIFVSAFATQWGIGAIIGLWPLRASGAYDPAGHQAAFFAMIALQIISLIWYCIPIKPRSGAAA
ncbi:MAG: MFS transporter [Rhodospirillales bacterium]|nr:MFS transporter [Rhodospirillales bacterium]